MTEKTWADVADKALDGIGETVRQVTNTVLAGRGVPCREGWIVSEEYLKRIVGDWPPARDAEGRA